MSDQAPEPDRYLAHLAPAVEAAIRASERERCAKVCELIEDGKNPHGDTCAGLAWECAAAIRELGDEQ
jgi:hypothetical protein